MFKKSIKARAMSVINERIDAVQKEHDEALKVMEQRHEQEKNKLTDSAVDKVIGQFVTR